ncbi:MAG: ribonuclease D [Endozoicomonas sp. (ex Botrylloides leachii)]|nr:ribonuclease D [Endozoicomonas sp. (ex Botrylloides leachii)]
MPQEYTDPIWITNNTTLDQYCQHWLTCERIALDTEFIRTDTYYPVPALIQLNTAKAIFFIDPLNITQWQPFQAVLEHPNCLKILHACSEDLEVFQRLAGTTPQPLFDTQLAAAYANIGYSISYKKLVNILLGLDLDQNETRSNWRQRPLTVAQVRYAALDVVYLIEIHTQLERLMNEKAVNPSLWLKDDCRRMNSAIFNQDANTAWKQVKCVWQLRPQQLSVLKALCCYQHKQAQLRDIPKGRVIPKGSLWALARYQPDNLASLSHLAGIHPSFVKKEGNALLKIIRAAQNLPEAEWPPRQPGPLPKKIQPYGKAIKRFLAEQAHALALPKEIFLPSKISTAILRSGINDGQFSLPDNLQGWRRDVIGQPLIAWLNERLSHKGFNNKCHLN